MTEARKFQILIWGIDMKPEDRTALLEQFDKALGEARWIALGHLE